jgi:hypothetical protein
VNGKGSNPRPSSVPKSVRDANWERTFGRYADEQALAKRVAVDLRGVLAKLEDEPKVFFGPNADGVYVIGQFPMPWLHLNEPAQPATPCHDFLPSTGSHDDD